MTFTHFILLLFALKIQQKKQSDVWQTMKIWVQSDALQF